MFSNAATGVATVEASTSKPSGACCTESPWDIHTRCSPGMSPSRVPRLVTWTGVRPNSEMPVRATSPPIFRAIAWKP